MNPPDGVAEKPVAQSFKEWRAGLEVLVKRKEELGTKVEVRALDKIQDEQAANEILKRMSRVLVVWDNLTDEATRKLLDQLESHFRSDIAVFREKNTVPDGMKLPGELAADMIKEFLGPVGST